MVYIEVTFKSEGDKYFNEILIAELIELGYESFNETEEDLLAYIPEDHFDELQLGDLREKYSSNNLKYFSKKIYEEDWNKVWESNFKPVVIAKKCLIRASFHEATGRYPYEIIIDPKMSFGTGHHQTTSMMIEYLLCINVEHTDVLDIGCGTGVLSILASKMNARRIDALDVDKWAVENCRENLRLNNVHNVDVHFGTILSFNKTRQYNYLLVNIHRKVIQNELSTYSEYLKNDGQIALSGFLEKDSGIMISNAESLGLQLDTLKKADGWCLCIFSKSNC